MKWIKTYKVFENSDLYKSEDIIKVIESGGNIWVKTIKDLPDFDTENPIKPTEVDNNGDITVEIDGEYYFTKLNYVYKIEY